MEDVIYIVLEGEYEDVYISLVTTNQDKAIKESLKTERKQIEMWKDEKLLGSYGYLTSDSFDSYEDVKRGIEKVILEG